MSRPAHPDPEEVAWRIEDDRSTRCAILPPMPTPTLTQLTIAGVRATLNSTGSWERMPDADQRAAKARMRWELDAVAKRIGVEPGAIYEAGPSDPPPGSPAP